MPLTADQDLLEHGMRDALMAIQTRHSETQVEREPWQATAVAAGAGSGITVAVIGATTLLLRATGH